MAIIKFVVQLKYFLIDCDRHDCFAIYFSVVEQKLTQFYRPCRFDCTCLLTLVKTTRRFSNMQRRKLLGENLTLDQDLQKTIQEHNIKLLTLFLNY